MNNEAFNSDPIDPSPEPIPFTPTPAATDSSPSNTLTITPQNKTLQQLTSLLVTLDILTFLQITTLYYLDPSTLLLTLRTLSQLFFVSPHTSSVYYNLSFTLPQPGQSFPPVLLSNFICLGTHLFRSLPQPGDIGLLVDFVGVDGQQVSRWQLLGLDLLVWGLQMVTLVVAVEKARVRDPGGHREENRQDHDAEEAGVRRSQEGIELQRFSGGRLEGDGDDEDDDDARIGESEVNAAHPLDRLFTGDNMLIEIDVWKTLRSALAKSATTGSRTTGSSTVDSGLLGTMIARMARDQSTS